MKAITICQPYASAIVGIESFPPIKAVENRKWPTRHRGKLLIHAGKSTAWLKKIDITKDKYHELLEEFMPFEDLPYGAIIGMVELEDCVHIDDLFFKYKCNEYGFAWGPWCWILGSAVLFKKAIPCNGMLGQWEYSDNIIEKWIKKYGVIKH